ncbi:hypothetical protein AMTRI_Chr03g145760 [Amborella trichopoda]
MKYLLINKFKFPESSIISLTVADNIFGRTIALDQVVWKGTNGGEAISFSGCDDHQTSADTLLIMEMHITA